MKKCLVFIPAYNEEKNLDCLFKEFKKYKKQFDIVVIDDGSSDNTVYTCKKEKIRCISHPKNMGIPQALKTGLLYAQRKNYSTVVRIDGDGQHCPKDISALIETAQKYQADMVVGSRYVKSRSFKADPFRVFFSLFISKYIKMLTGKKISDPTSGFFLLNKKTYKEILKKHLENHYEPSIVTYFLLRGFTVREHRVEMRSRFFGTSSLSYFRGLYVGAIILLQVTWIKGILSQNNVWHFRLLPREWFKT